MVARAPKSKLLSNNQDRDSTILGSAVQHLSQNAVCPLLIFKDNTAQRKNRTGGHYRFGVCTDGSLKSLEAFDFIAKLMRPGDNLVVITVADEIIHADKV